MIHDQLALNSTIAAIASAPGGAARGIVRIAGQGTATVIAGCFKADDGLPLAELQNPAHIAGQIVLSDLGARALPCDLYFWPTERSYCRTPMAELHTLGSPPLLAAVLRAVCAGGARVAEPGEFTLRAFLGGRIDLAQAEAVLGVIDAQGQQDFQVALSQLSGGLSHPLARLRNDLLDTLAHLEAGLDFVEEDIDFISAAEVQASLAAALAQVEDLAAQMNTRTEASQAVKVVLRGLPNAGKSSLFNALAARFGLSSSTLHSSALVSPQPGTTRDYLSARVIFDGIECELIDTAGLDDRGLEGADGEAQTRARQQIARADVEIICLDGSRPSIAARAGQWPSQRSLAQGATIPIIALTKGDLPRQIDTGSLPETILAIDTSATTGAGMSELAAAIQHAVGDADKREAALVPATIQRCHESLATAAACLREAQALASRGGVEELLAAEIRAALHALGSVTGAIYTDDILDRVFSRFCIGK